MIYKPVYMYGTCRTINLECHDISQSSRLDKGNTRINHECVSGRWGGVAFVLLFYVPVLWFSDTSILVGYFAILVRREGERR